MPQLWLGGRACCIKTITFRDGGCACQAKRRWEALAVEVWGCHDNIITWGVGRVRLVRQKTRLADGGMRVTTKSQLCLRARGPNYDRTLAGGAVVTTKRQLWLTGQGCYDNYTTLGRGRGGCYDKTTTLNKGCAWYYKITTLPEGGGRSLRQKQNFSGRWRLLRQNHNFG